MNSRIRFISAMLIFGSIGVFVKNIDLSSSSIAFLRGMLGSLFLIGVSIIIRKKPSFQRIRENGILLFFSGAAIGFNWILLFQAYKYTTISNATLSYYFAPVFVMLLAPFVLKEKLTFIKIASIIAAMIGLFLIVNVGSNVTEGSFNHTIGILYGLSAAVLYASVILMNKFIKNLSGIETTVIQLLLATLVLLPYVLIKDQINLSSISLQSGIYILILGIFHTGIAYFLYFTSFKDLKAQSIAVLSYVDPISAVVFAAVFLGESMSLIQILGGILILGSTYLSERLTAQLSRTP
ncbi:DMT family transporter [Desulfitobacterium sp.]|uniref:DMT family transporter n=1 Tax=Desulfitobacterium sp. TaxID=49981 RepID=UPI002B21774A|nr:EamA family transporter [Desulfitobacterium sp.]MEA4902020.1 EamA family transporter [Desulfitobacterium sp.]